MAEGSTFAKIKRVVEQEKNKKVAGEAKIAQLNDEKKRIFNQINQEFGKPVSEVEEVEAIHASLKTEIESDISKMLEILKSEGIEI